MAGSGRCRDIRSGLSHKCGNVKSWEFTCLLWEEPGFPEDSEESLGQEEKGNLGTFGLCRWRELAPCPPGDRTGAVEDPERPGGLPLFVWTWTSLHSVLSDTDPVLPDRNPSA